MTGALRRVAAARVDLRGDADDMSAAAAVTLEGEGVERFVLLYAPESDVTVRVGKQAWALGPLTRQTR